MKVMVEMDKKKISYNKGGFYYLVVDNVDEELISPGKVLGLSDSRARR
jgi:hypothetical protein